MRGATLLDSHKEELIQKRGFSDKTILVEGFGSGGQHVLQAEAALEALRDSGEVTEDDLVKSGVFIHDGKRAVINPILMRKETEMNGKKSSNILIPYRNADGSIYCVRPHKMGLSGVPAEIYQKAYLAIKPEEIILTEGEFKTAAAVQYGFNAIGIPGISSFSEKKFPEFIKILNDSGVKRIVIMFDNETKDDPSFPNYKDNPHDRYDTQFYAYYMAQRLEKEAREVKIATLPDSWKVNGKIDIDMASAQLRTRGEMLKVVYDALPKNEYLLSLEHEARTNVSRKMNQKFHKSKVKREFNRYVVTRHKGKGVSWEEPISNFVMRVVATHDTSEGVKREVEFVNENGRKSSGFVVAPKEMSSSEAFRTFALSRGDYVWRGTVEDLLTIWESEFLMMDEGRYILESDHVGWIQRENLWLFGNMAITSEGKEIRPDTNGIFWLEKRGIKVVPLAMSNSKSASVEGVPYLSTGKIDLLDVRAPLY